MDEGAGGRVLGIGELLSDLFPDGPRLGLPTGTVSVAPNPLEGHRFHDPLAGGV